MEALAGWRTAYYSVTLGITYYTYFPGDDGEARARRSAQRDADEGYEGSAPVRVEYSEHAYTLAEHADGKTWKEVARYEAPAIVADALAYEGS